MEDKIINMESVQDYNEILGVETLHPLVSVVDLAEVQQIRHCIKRFGYYCIFLKQLDIWVQGRKIAPCLACYYCKDHKGECSIKDDMKEILEKMLAADVLVLSSPVYFYSISAQLCETLFILLNSAPDYSLQSGLIN